MGMYKSLKYTGKTNWKVFYTKFRGYARTAGWTEEQKKDQLKNNTYHNGHGVAE
jgi:hypothetical protein